MSGTRQANMASKISERIFLHSFLKLMPGFVIENESASQERPDFVLRDAIGRIGMEVTQVFRSSTPKGSRGRERESRRQKFLRELADAYYSNGAPVSVKAQLPHGPNDDPKEIAAGIRAARPSEAWSGTSICSKSGSKYWITALPGDVGECREWHCIDNHLGWVGEATWDLITSRIQAKATLLEEYKRVISRIALLLVVDRTYQSGMLQMPPMTRPIEPLGFNGIYLFVHPLEAKRLA